MKELSHLPLPLVPSLNLKHHLLKMVVDVRNVSHHAP
jgi:hypothetical protein